MPAGPPSLKELFLAVLAVPPGDQPAWLEKNCGKDADLRQRVELMLAAHDTSQSLLDHPEPAAALPEGATADLVGPESERPGTVIGPYKLLEQIGEGGFGVVFMAEQIRPVRRKVALKVLKPGMDTRQVVARFEAERQVLAIMDHPNIAKVFDGGATASGRPYFVMELVKGVPITEFCDQNHWTPRQRLELFVHVCQAVQHAHQKGIIHRDIKPSNVLVTMHDTTPVVKVIDFGVAKALGQQLTDKTLFTGFAQMIGTPLYMSPEQAGQSGLDIDTRSDIYSLGVLLYELLTGTTPFDKERLRTAAYDEIRRIIREEEPAKPSTRMSTLGQAARTVSTNRQSDPKRLTQLMRGELDWIVMKALEKDRNRRYDTANAFAADVQHYSADEAVQACPPTAMYRMRKFLRRNKRPVTAAGLVLVALLAGIVGTTVGIVRALQAERLAEEANTKTTRALAESEESRQQAQAVSDFLVEAFRKPDPEQDGRELKVVDLLDQAAKKLDTEFTGPPEIDAALLDALGDTYSSLGLPANAVEMFEKARAVRQAVFGPDHDATLKSVSRVAAGYYYAGRRAEAQELLQDTLRLQKAKLGPDHADTLMTMNRLAVVYQQAGRLSEAVLLKEEALRLTKTKYGPNHPETLKNMARVACIYQFAGRFAEAIALNQETVGLQKLQLGPDHRETLSNMGNLALNHQAAGQIAEAIRLHEEALQLMKARLGRNHLETLDGMEQLAVACHEGGRRVEALALLEETLKLREAKLGADHPRTLTTKSNLAAVAREHGDYVRAESMFLELLTQRRKKLGVEHPHVADTIANHGLTYLRQRRYHQAEPFLRDALAIRVKKAPESWTTFSSKAMLGDSLLGQKKYAEAESLLLAGYEGLKHGENAIPPFLVKETRATEALERLVQLYNAWGKPDKAAEWLKKLAAEKSKQKK
jgi:serine/threonine protein kinase